MMDQLINAEKSLNCGCISRVGICHFCLGNDVWQMYFPGEFHSVLSYTAACTSHYAKLNDDYKEDLYTLYFSESVKFSNNDKRLY